MILLTQLHLATPHGRVSSFFLTGINLKAKFLHGWILTTISGFIIHANLLITNPDFKDGFDYATYQEHDINGSHHYHNLMSENWAWRQAVCNFKASLSACTLYA